MKKIILPLLLLTLCLPTLTSCSNTNKEIIDYIKEHLQTNTTVIYEEPQVLLDEDHTFSFSISETASDTIKDEGYTKDSLFRVYVDADLTQELEVRSHIKEGNVIINPPNDSVLTSYKGNEYHFSDRSHWGLYHHFHLVQYFDLETGNALETPIVTIFTVDNPIETPVVTSIVYEDDRSFTISWDDIDIADEYYLIRIDFNAYYAPSVHILDSTEKTTWNSTVDGDDLENAQTEVFRAYAFSEDEQYTMDLENWWQDDTVFSIGSIFGIATREYNSLSNISYFDTTQHQRESLVCQSAAFASQEIAFSENLETIEDIPYQLPVSACSGNTVHAEVLLDTDKATVEGDTLLVPYTFENSTLQGSFYISSFSSSYKEALQAKSTSMHEAYKQVENPEYRYQYTKVIPFNIKRSNRLPDIQDTIFSTSELETFIAANMIDGAAMIDISSFENVSNYVYIYDLIEQVRNQNPLVLEILDYDYDIGEKKIYIHYLYDDVTRAERQQTIREAVTRVAGEIFTESMSDVEKIYAINTYICDNTVYNDAAANASGNQMHEDYYYANTAEGVFIHGSAVCEGYATAFMLLADAVDIKSMMVTGYGLDNLDSRHAWNRVLLNDQWYVVDVTHNDMEETPNSVLLLADVSADKIYIADAYYVLDDDLTSYQATGEDIYEYYRYHNLYVSTNDAASVVIKQLQNNNRATIRVPIETTEYQFDQIADKIVASINHSIRYYYTNGVLTVKKI